MLRSDLSLKLFATEITDLNCLKFSQFANRDTVRIHLQRRENSTSTCCMDRLKRRCEGEETIHKSRLEFGNDRRFEGAPCCDIYSVSRVHIF